MLIRTFAWIYKYWSIWLSAIVFISVYVFLLEQLLNGREFNSSFSKATTDILTVSGIMSAIIIAYLTSKVLQIRQEKVTRLHEYNELTQKVHRYRAVLNKLKNSAVGFGRGNSSVLQKEFDKMIPEAMGLNNILYSDFDTSEYYSCMVVEKWIDDECGNGLWYHFDLDLDERKSNALNSLPERDKNIIVGHCMRIDEMRYKSMEFGPTLMSKLGTQFYEDIFPKLYDLQLRFKKKLPNVINYLYILLCLLIMFGILLPLFTRLLEPTVAQHVEIVSFAVVIAICFNIVFSFYAFLKNEIKIDLGDFF